jgi:hypothetical protein
MPDSSLVHTDHPDYVETEKYRLWFYYWSNPECKDTYANATQAAIKAYSYDPVRQYQVARVTGSKNITKANNLCQDLLEQKSWGIPKMLDFAITQMIASKDKGANWWKNIMLVSGAYKMQSVVAIQNNVNITNVQVEKEQAQKFSNEFESFIDQKYSTPDQPKIAIETVG